MILGSSAAPRRAAAAIFLLIAGHAAEGPAALVWDFSLGASLAWYDNLHLDPEPTAEGQREPVQETVYAGVAGFGLEWSKGPDHLTGQYHGEYWEFSGDEERDPTWVHALGAELGWRRWSPYFLEVREDFTRVPRSQEREGVSVVDQIDSSRLVIRTGLVQEWGGRGALELAYGREELTFPGTDDADSTLRQYGEGLVRYRWTPLWGSEFRVSYGELARVLAPDAVELTAAASVHQRVSERLDLHYRLEWIRDEEDRPPGDGGTPDGGPSVRTSLLKSFEATGTLRAGPSWSLAYQDSLDYLADGDTLKTGRASADVTFLARLGSSLRAGGWYAVRDFRVSGREETAWGPTARARWVIAGWIACDLSAAWTSTEIRAAGLPAFTDRTTAASLGFVAVVARSVTLEAGYQFRQNDSDDPARSYTSNQFSALVTYHLRALAPGTIPPFAGGGAPGR